jgi:hypothetical protein
MCCIANLESESYLSRERCHILRINLLNALGLSGTPLLGDATNGTLTPDYGIGWLQRDVDDRSHDSIYYVNSR